MILVTVGTHHQPFDRLVRAAAALQRAGHEVVAQVGTSSVPILGGRAFVPPGELAALARQAEVVVCHAAPASAALAWEAGRTPVVVPRRRDLGEHVDDHQVVWARTVVDRAVLCEAPERLVEGWADLRSRVRDLPPLASEASPEFLAAWEAVVWRAVEASRARGVRATLARLLREGRRWGR